MLAPAHQAAYWRAYAREVFKPRYQTLNSTASTMSSPLRRVDLDLKFSLSKIGERFRFFISRSGNPEPFCETRYSEESNRLEIYVNAVERVAHAKCPEGFSDMPTEVRLESHDHNLKVWQSDAVYDPVLSHPGLADLTSERQLQVAFSRRCDEH